MTEEKPNSEPSIKSRLIQAATELFAEQGFAGTSVRQICARADASVPMISHYFGGKQGLYDAIMTQARSHGFDVPIRIISGGLRSREDFLTKFELFISEVLNAFLDLSPILRISSRDGIQFGDTDNLHKAFADFLNQAQAKGFLRPTIRVELVTGLVLDRIGNQVLFALNPSYAGPDILVDRKYRDEWLEANTEVLLYGLAGT